MTTPKCNVAHKHSIERLDLLIATNNNGKLEEFSELLADTQLRLHSLLDVGIDFDVPETGTTFNENAVIKAKAYTAMSGLLTLADDSGLEVEALGGDPGVYSSRYAGESATDKDRVALLLRNLGDTPPSRRNARFRCVIAIAVPQGQIDLFEGECRGTITRSPRGNKGFGYDPVFLPEGTNRTMAELSREEKNCISHRSRAASKAVQMLKTFGQK